MLSFFIQQTISKNWAVFAAGSEGFRNYRHQSDVFQAYQILKDRGFDKKNMILMAFDDVVESSENPKKGRIFNLKKNVDVHPPLEEIAYRGKECSADNFVKVITGEATNSHSPVLQSTSNDDVFIYYNDHGSPGFLCFPSGTGNHLSGNTLRDAVKKMAEKKMFRNLFIVLEACFSGSVAKLLDDIPGVFVISAAGPLQSSYSHGYDNDIMVFRTNEFTNNFFKFILQNPSANISTLFNFTRINTYGSDVQRFGDKKFLELPVSEFLGEADPSDGKFENAEYYESNSRISSMHTQMSYYDARMKHTKNQTEARELHLRKRAERDRRSISRRVFEQILAPFTGKNAKEAAVDFPDHPDWTCYERAVETFRQSCGELDEYEMKRISALATVCEDHDESKILKRIKHVCPHRMWTLINQ